VSQQLFGGSSSKSQNKAYPYISSTFGEPAGSDFTGASNALADALGLNGASGQSSALDNFWNSAGGQFQLNQGLDALTSKFAGMGLYKSGAAGKAMEQYRQGLASTYYNNWLSQLENLGRLGLGGGSLVANAGQTSKGSSSTGNMGTDLFAIMSAISDRRLKTNIKKVGEASDGLGLYEWNWRADPNGPTVRGVIADEVEKLRPWAFVKGFVGGVYDGVNYGALGSLA
jgi:hypothetical protein